MRTGTAIVIVGLVLGWPVPSVHVSAECITVARTLERRLQETPLVFVGEVLGTENLLLPESYRVRVRFRVVEPFRGIDAGEQAVSFRPTAEDYKFEVGQRVLVYATGTRDNYSTQCTGTRVTGAQDLEVQDLRRLVRK
jgi:hypothetical protein